MNNLNIAMKSKKLSNLIDGLGTLTSDVEIQGFCDDTRRIQAGDAFLCLPRAKNVSTLIQSATQQGASAIIMVGSERYKAELPCAYLEDMGKAGLMLRRWFETETLQLPCIGITGTDGKTSTAWMLREILGLHLGLAWSCGTLGLVKDSDDITDLGNTTPSMLTLHTLYALAAQANVGVLILEVSSHGIAQERIAGLPFSAAVWTTMGRDHLEDHGSFEAYLKCKADFITGVAKSGGIVVANADYDLIHTALASTSGRIFWYGSKQQSDLLWLREEQDITLTNQVEEITLNAMPVADFHAENLAAIALLLKESFEMPLSGFKAVDGHITTPKGRLEPVNDDNQVFIDYAHTAEGLSRCLQSAKELTKAKLLLVFGCGGDRDKGKRPEMGAVAAKFADECWLTSDNPRSESQDDIAADVLEGTKKSKVNIHVRENRDLAIEQAVFALNKEDVLVIAGKGHESYMEIKGQRLPWSDKASALRAIHEKEVRQCA
ncbi:MAG: UDP-N-acetylmuramoyl-L-alanyl-D-glutamate--2,6-diaminopimelate ligase [Ghiorsea sp.]